MWQVIYNITKKWWDRHKGHGSDRTSVPVWPNVRQKKKVFANSEIAQIFIKHNAATKDLTFPTTDIGHPSFSWLDTDIFTWKKGKVKQGFIYENAQKKVLENCNFFSWKVLEKSLILLNKKVYEPWIKVYLQLLVMSFCLYILSPNVCTLFIQ